MGYESKLYVVNKWTIENMKDEKGNDYTSYEILGSINGSYLDIDFEKLFLKKFDGELYDFVCSDYIKEDKYNRPLTYDTLDNVLNWVIGKKEIEHYRRYDLIYGMLNAINPKDWDEIIIVHYGY